MNPTVDGNLNPTLTVPSISNHLKLFNAVDSKCWSGFRWTSRGNNSKETTAPTVRYSNPHPQLQPLGIIGPSHLPRPRTHPCNLQVSHDSKHTCITYPMYLQMPYMHSITIPHTNLLRFHAHVSIPYMYSDDICGTIHIVFHALWALSMSQTHIYADLTY